MIDTCQAAGVCESFLPESSETFLFLNPARCRLTQRIRTEIKLGAHLAAKLSTHQTFSLACISICTGYDDVYPRGYVAVHNHVWGRRVE